MALTLSVNARAADIDAASQATFNTAMAFMGAMGSGDMEKIPELMADDIVWQNEGDSAMPWIGPGMARKKSFNSSAFSAKNPNNSLGSPRETANPGRMYIKRRIHIPLMLSFAVSARPYTLNQSR